MSSDEDRNLPWARWVRDHRKSANITRRRMAELCQIDPSYVTLIERDGYTPRRGIVSRIGMLFGDVYGALVVAGMIPLEHRGDIVAFLRGQPPARIPQDIAPAMRDLAEAPSDIRRQAVAVLNALLRDDTFPARGAQ